MKKTFIASLLLLMLFSGCDSTQNNSLMITLKSVYPLQETVSRFTKGVEKKGYRVTAVMDHTIRAKQENIYLHPTLALTLDNPKVFSALLTCNPSLAIDLPVRVAVYSQLGGAVKLSYTQPEYWSLKHNIKDKNCIAVILEMTRDFNEVVETIKK